MRLLSGRDGDISTKCRDIRSLLGNGIAVVCRLCLLFADGEAESATRTEDTGLLDLFVVFRMRIALCRDRREIPSGGDVHIVVCSNICRRKGCVTFCRNVDILPRDIRRTCNI